MAGTPTSIFLHNKEVDSQRSASDILTERGVTPTGRERDLHFIEIDGNKVGGYGSYSFYIQKTYSKEPTRSSSGVIDNLDSYVTFLTPTVKIKFNAVSALQYRTIKDMMHSKNEHLVRCYDVEYDTYRTFNAYFAPDDYPELFVLDFEMLGVVNYEIELIGTNTDVSKVSVTYHINDPSGTITTTVGSSDLPMGSEFIIGKDAASIKTLEGYTFDRWNTKPDGTGDWYIDGTAYSLNRDLVLYAQWLGGDEYKISFDYGIGEIPKDENNENITSKNIKYGDVITFTSTNPKKVTFLEEEYMPYEETPRWYWTPQKVEGSQEIENGVTKYEIKGNSTIHQIHKAKTYRVTFYSDLTIKATKSTVSGEYGSSIAFPDLPEGTSAWYLMFVGEGAQTVIGTEFTETTMPPVNISVYAK